MIFLELSQQSLKCTKKDLLLFLFPFAILRKDSIISHVTKFNSLLALTKLDYFEQTILPPRHFRAPYHEWPGCSPRFDPS